MTPRAVLLLLLAVSSAAVALASCSSAPAAVRVPERVAIEVPVPCVRPQDLPQRPQVRSEVDLMAMDRYRRTLAAWSDLKKLEAYAAELEAIAAGCSRLPAAR